MKCKHSSTRNRLKNLTTVVLFLIVLVGLPHIVLFRNHAIKSVARTAVQYSTVEDDWITSSSGRSQGLSYNHAPSSEMSQAEEEVEDKMKQRATKVDLELRNVYQPIRVRSHGISAEKAKKLERVATIEMMQKQNDLTIPKPVNRKDPPQSPATNTQALSAIKAKSQNVQKSPVVDIPESSMKQILRHLDFSMRRLLPEEMAPTKTCEHKGSVGNSCGKNGCLQRQLPESFQTRIEQLTKPAALHPSPVYTEVIETMGDAVPQFYDIIVVTGASSNHYLESKALMHNLKENLFPHLRNFTFIYYNLGLTDEQKEEMSSICQCRVVDFPFHKFPSHVSILKCYSWKPLIVSAHAPHCNVLMWVDSSIRFLVNPSYIRELLRVVRVRGFQSGTNRNLIPHVTMREMFHFFGDEACAYMPYTEAMSGLALFSNEPVVRWVILRAWAACALNESCMCLHKVKDPRLARVSCAKRTGPYDYGWCHRFDQSALGIIVRKIFLYKSQNLFLPNIRDFLEIKRGDKWNETVLDVNDDH